MSVNPKGGGVVKIPIADKKIAFTATHLAEIQEIFKVQGWGNNAPKRKPILGKSTEDDDFFDEV